MSVVIESLLRYGTPAVIGWAAAAIFLWLFGRRLAEAYGVRRAENLADKEDISELTRLVEAVKLEHQRQIETLKHDLEESRVRAAEERRVLAAFFEAAVDLAFVHLWQAEKRIDASGADADDSLLQVERAMAVVIARGMGVMAATADTTVYRAVQAFTARVYEARDAFAQAREQSSRSGDVAPILSVVADVRGAFDDGLESTLNAARAGALAVGEGT